MERPPPLRYARTQDGLSPAYQVFGSAADLLLVWGGVSHIELFRDDPTLARIFRRLASCARVIRYDRPGTGMSDRPPGPATLEQRMQDVTAALDAVGSPPAAVLGESESAPMACVSAAARPERVSALILYGPVIRMPGDAEFPWATAREVFEPALEHTTAEWGSEDLIWGWAPTVGDDPRARQFFSRLIRMSCSPGAYRDQMLVNRRLDRTRRAPGDGPWRRLLDELGDGMLASFEAASAIGRARASMAAVGSLGVELRAGVHTGECELWGSDLAGLAVHVDARVGSLAGPGRGAGVRDRT